MPIVINDYDFLQYFIGLTYRFKKNDSMVI